MKQSIQAEILQEYALGIHEAATDSWDRLAARLFNLMNKSRPRRLQYTGARLEEWHYSRQLRARPHLVRIVDGHRFIVELPLRHHINVKPAPRLREIVPIRKPGAPHAPSRGELMLMNGHPDLAAHSGQTSFMFHASQSHIDTDGKKYPVLVLKNLTMHRDFRGSGLATALVRMMARELPDHLIAGESPSPQALRWHARLRREFPTRMVHDTTPRRRVTPATPLDPHELS